MVVGKLVHMLLNRQEDMVVVVVVVEKVDSSMMGMLVSRQCNIVVGMEGQVVVEFQVDLEVLVNQGLLEVLVVQVGRLVLVVQVDHKLPVVQVDQVVGVEEQVDNKL